MERDDAQEPTPPFEESSETSGTTTTTTNPPPPPPGAGQHHATRLSRSSSDRFLAGVAGGLGRYFGVDPVLVRIGLVILCIAGGTGVVLYLLGWLLIPEEGDSESMALRALRGRDSRTRTVAVVGALALLAVGVTEPFRHRSWPSGAVWPLALIGMGFVLLHSRQTNHQSRADDAEPETWWSRPAPSAPAPPAVDRPATVTPYLAGGLVVLAGGAALLGLTDALHVTAAGYLASALTLAGAAWLVGAWRGRVGSVGLIAVVLAGALAVTMAVPVSFDGGTGSRVAHPAGAADLRSPYRLGIGDLTVDLTDVHASTPVVARLGVGHLLIIVPDGSTVTTRARVGVGKVEVFGGNQGGLSVDRSSVDRGVGSDAIDLDVRVGVGEIEVHHAGG